MEERFASKPSRPFVSTQHLNHDDDNCFHFFLTLRHLIDVHLLCRHRPGRSRAAAPSAILFLERREIPRKGDYSCDLGNLIGMPPGLLVKQPLFFSYVDV